MDKNEVFKAVAETISERTDCPIEDVKNDSTFRDLGIDSLDTVELVMELEDKLGITIELEGKLATVGEFVDYITKG